MGGNREDGDKRLEVMGMGQEAMGTIQTIGNPNGIAETKKKVSLTMGKHWNIGSQRSWDPLER